MSVWRRRCRSARVERKFHWAACNCDNAPVEKKRRSNQRALGKIGMRRACSQTGFSTKPPQHLKPKACPCEDGDAEARRGSAGFTGRRAIVTTPLWRRSEEAAKGLVHQSGQVHSNTQWPRERDGGACTKDKEKEAKGPLGRLECDGHARRLDFHQASPTLRA